MRRPKRETRQIEPEGHLTLHPVRVVDRDSQEERRRRNAEVRCASAPAKRTMAKHLAEHAPEMLEDLTAIGKLELLGRKLGPFAEVAIEYEDADLQQSLRDEMHAARAKAADEAIAAAKAALQPEDSK